MVYLGLEVELFPVFWETPKLISKVFLQVCNPISNGAMKEVLHLLICRFLIFREGWLAPENSLRREERWEKWGLPVWFRLSRADEGGRRQGWRMKIQGDSRLLCADGHALEDSEGSLGQLGISQRTHWAGKTRTVVVKSVSSSSLTYNILVDFS